MVTKLIELYGVSTRSQAGTNWDAIVNEGLCPYLGRKCLKVRKSKPDITIGTCSTLYGRENKDIIICPYRLLERRQIFIDCIHLLTLHEPGNELHIFQEVPIPGGSVDYFLASVRNKEVKDFVGIELQTLDTTGTVWPERQRFLQGNGIAIEDSKDADSKKPFGMNWKMTAKTILMQLNHKVETFQEINKHLVLIIQDHFMSYIKSEFRFAHLNNALMGDSMHFHVYGLKSNEDDGAYNLELNSRYSTDAKGIAECLGLQTNPRMELEVITKLLEEKISKNTLFTLQ